MPTQTDAPMRVLLDTNIFISYLLSINSNRVVAKIVKAAVTGDYQLLIIEELLIEIIHTVQNKPDLQARIPLDALEELITILRTLAETIPMLEAKIPSLTRDPKDDYLLAYALVGAADYLVTDDKDLLVLKRVADVIIISIHDFWVLLKSEPSA
ncbi:MAG: putative toxin-antitoxin system toxin component, PIN family [Chloroflexota bacterium]|nr:putative toxin-antitoxin system toxin component, PIN family [Chloroflexota bacterium]